MTQDRDPLRDTEGNTINFHCTAHQHAPSDPDLLGLWAATR